MKSEVKVWPITKVLFMVLVILLALTGTGALSDLLVSPTQARDLIPIAANDSAPLNDPIAPANTFGTIIDSPYDQNRSAIAYGSQRKEYLVVWEDHDWSGLSFIYGRRVSTNGALVGNPFMIAGWEAGQSPRHRQAPDVAYNHTNDEFLVVYEYVWSDTDHDVYARRVNSGGTLIGGEFAIGTAINFEGNPAVAYNSANKEYLVVWEYRAGSGEFTHNDIYGRRVAANGTPLFTSFAIANGSLDESAPALAYGGGVYLMVWQDKQAGTGEYDIYGRRLGNNGSLIGSKIAISTWQYDQLKPRLAFNTVMNEFLVAWEDHHWGWGNDWDIYGQRVNPNGTLNGGNFGISWEGSNHRENPDVAYDPTADKYLVAWEYEFSVGDHDVHCRQVGSDGTPETTMVISSLYSHEKGPVVAADNVGSYLIVWEDERNVTTQGIDLYYWLMSSDGGTGSNRLYLPIILRASS